MLNRIFPQFDSVAELKYNSTSTSFFLLALGLKSVSLSSDSKPQAPLLVCFSVNSFKFQPCDHTPPKARTFKDFSTSSALDSK